MGRAGWCGPLACLIALPSMAQGTTPGWKTYINTRFAYSVCYPVDMLLPKGESDNGDGESFLLKGQDHGRVLVFARWAGATVDGRTPRMASEYADAQRQMREDGFQPGYSMLKPTFFVVSGSGGEKIRYQRTMRAGDRDITLLFDYPVAAKQAMGGVVSKMSECLTAGKN